MRRRRGAFVGAATLIPCCECLKTKTASACHGGAVTRALESLHEGARVDGDDVTLGNDRPARGHLPGLLQGV
jgi:hypothetical protein